MKNFCAEPWKQLFIGPDSKVKTCCSGRDPIGDLQENNLSEIIQGEKLREIKLSILEDKQHSNCGLCYELEANGAFTASQRNRTKDDYLTNLDFYKNNIDYHTPEILDIRWDNTCNLACNYCMPYFSSVWASIKKETQVAPRTNDGVLEYAISKKDEIQSLYLLGGEPFLQKRNLSLLENISEKIHPVVVTNLSVPLGTNKIYEVLSSKFKRVSFNLSFDTIGDRFEYVRHGASWSVFLDNLEIIKKDFNEHPMARPLYCIYSAFNIEEYYDFCVANDLTILWQKMEHPRELNVNLLPAELKQKAIQEIDNVVKKFSKYDKNINCGHLQHLDLDNLKSIGDSLKENTTHNAHDVLEYHKTLENVYHNKKHTLQDLWPEVYNELIKYTV